MDTGSKTYEDHRCSTANLRVRVRYTDAPKRECRAIFHFDGEIEPGQPVAPARVWTGAPEEITTRTVPPMFADQLEQEFAGTEDELDISKIPSRQVFVVSKESFINARAR